MATSPVKRWRAYPTKTYSRPRIAVLNQHIQPAAKRRRTRYEIGDSKLLSGHVGSSSPTASSPESYEHCHAFDSPSRSATTPLSSPPPQEHHGIPSDQDQSGSETHERLSSKEVDKQAAPLARGSGLGRESVMHRKKRRPMTQTQIDLGQDTRRVCKTCGMDYIPSHAEDARMHKTFHAMNVGGIDLGKAMTRNLDRKKLWLSETVDEAKEGRPRDFIAVIDQTSSVTERQKAKRVLDVVNSELSAMDLEDDRGWERLFGAPAARGDVPRATPSLEVAVGDEVKVYLYVKGEKCVGLCLAKRISRAHRVLPRPMDTQDAGPLPSSSVSIDPETEAAVLGISRIWTSSSHRRRGIGRTLLDCAREHFIFGMKLSKDMVAFSQPTESGGHLARRWCGVGSPWRVYIER